jgi:hypothetical protein
MITQKDLNNWFTYHEPSDLHQRKYSVIRNAALEFAKVVVDNTPSSADQTTAIRKIREAVMIANASIACEKLI